MMIKPFARYIEKQVTGRSELYRAGDRRALSPFCSTRLLETASRWLPMLPPGFKPRTVLDVGANVGAVSLELKELYRPDFIGMVEANPELAGGLQGLELGCETIVFSCAVGREPGRLPFNIVRKGGSDNYASSSILLLTQRARELWRLEAERTVEVPVRTLDDIWAECGGGTLDLLKVDVQGYEHNVLMGGEETLKKTRVMVIEMSFFSEYEGQWLFGPLYDFLHGKGFDLSATREFARTPEGVPLQCNGVFVNTERAIGTKASVGQEEAQS